MTLVTLKAGGSWTKEADYVTKFINFQGFNDLLDDALAAGVHLPETTDYVVRLAGETTTTVPKATLAESLEPEYVTYKADSTKAYVICQEANTIAVLDLVSKEFTELRPLGWKSWKLDYLDPSDRVSPPPRRAAACACCHAAWEAAHSLAHRRRPARPPPPARPLACLSGRQARQLQDAGQLVDPAPARLDCLLHRQGQGLHCDGQRGRRQGAGQA